MVHLYFLSLFTVGGTVINILPLIQIIAKNFQLLVEKYLDMQPWVTCSNECKVFANYWKLFYNTLQVFCQQTDFYYQRMEPQCQILDILNFYLLIGKKLPISGNFLPLVSEVSQMYPRVWQFYILSNSFNQNQNKIGCLKYNFKIFISNYNAFGPNKKCMC